MRALATGIMLLALVGCAPHLGNIGKTSDPTRFYTLHATAEAPGEGEAMMPHVVLGVGPVSVADYLDRSQIVVREGAARLELAEFDRWAGNLAKEIQRVTMANLAGLLATEKVVSYPWKSSVVPDLTVEMAVERFEYGRDGQVWLAVAWQVYGDNGREVVAFRRSELSKPVDESYEAIAEGLSALLGQLAGEMAAVVRRVPPAMLRR